MTRSSVQVSPWATRALYLFALVLISMPLLDFLSSVMPARAGDFSWRYGALGLLPGYIHTPMLGLVLGLGVGYWQERAWVLRWGGGVALLAALGLLLLTGVFALDVVQMRGMRPEAEFAVTAGGILQSTKYMTAALVLALLGHGSMSTGGRMGRANAVRGAAKPGIVSRDGVTP
jgi:hypothetical protein